MQQTRVQQGLPYYETFLVNFPTVHHLANATENKVMKAWQGLGYYSRARNLHHSAKFISQQLQGIFPKEYDEIKKLKGIGEYTASAIASFAFNKPHAVVDGNVFRVLSRYFGIKIPIDSANGKSVFLKKAALLLDKKDPGTFNQAIMEFGALQCTPHKPDCKKCPLQKTCRAFIMNMVYNLPVKSQKTTIRTRYFNYFIIRKNRKILINKRTEKDIWQNMYDFPMMETKKDRKAPPLNSKVLKKKITGFSNFGRVSASHAAVWTGSKLYKHVLSHQIIFARFWEVPADAQSKSIVADLNPNSLNTIYVNNNQLNKYPFPRLIEKYLNEHGVKKSN
jgi:A/G-specific adenine glycosylase